MAKEGDKENLELERPRRDKYKFKELSSGAIYALGMRMLELEKNLKEDLKRSIQSNFLSVETSLDTSCSRITIKVTSTCSKEGLYVNTTFSKHWENRIPEPVEISEFRDLCVQNMPFRGDSIKKKKDKLFSPKE